MLFQDTSNLLAENLIGKANTMNSLASLLFEKRQFGKTEKLYRAVGAESTGAREEG
jgi:hypothetical protein